MGRPKVQHRCIQCGKPCPQRGRRRGGFSCIECAIGRYQQSNRDIHARQGEYYEKWIEGMAAAVAKARAQHDDQAPVTGEAGEG